MEKGKLATTCLSVHLVRLFGMNQWGVCTMYMSCCHLTLDQRQSSSPSVIKGNLLLSIYDQSCVVLCGEIGMRSFDVVKDPSPHIGHESNIRKC